MSVSMNSIILETASYQDLKNFCKSEIEELGYNPFGAYHMMSTQGLKENITNYLQSTPQNESVNESTVEPKPLDQAVELLQRTISILKGIVEENCDCDKIARMKELEELKHLANLIQVSI